MTLSAALVPTPAVMHMAGLAAAPRDGSSSREVVAVPLTEAGFLNLVEALAAEFERPAAGRAVSVSRGLYPGSRFYNARGEFHLFNTCNTWTARMLRAAGVAVSPSGIVTADGLMARLGAALERVRLLRRPAAVSERARECFRAKRKCSNYRVSSAPLHGYRGSG